MALIQTLFNKNDLLKSFLPLSQGGQIYLELLLINPKTQQVEGRGFFNDPDFVVEACTPLSGRFNFAISPFAFAADSIPSRHAYNQFDRTLQNAVHQDKGIPHSLSIAFQFRADLYQELDPAKGNHILQVVYLIDTILGRIPLKTFSLDFGGTFMTARFLPACAGNYPGLTRAQFLDVTRKLLERIEKEMFPQEHKKFQLLASCFGKVHDPLPGTPLVLGPEEGNTMSVTTAGSLMLANEPIFQQIFEEAVDGKKGRISDIYAPTNLQGLSQGWDDSRNSPLNGNVNGTGSLLMQEGLSNGQIEPRAKVESKPEPTFKDKRQLEDLAQYFLSMSQNRWRWPLPSLAFSRQYQGIGRGEMLILQCQPFGAQSGLHFLMQAAEVQAREQGSQILVFTKRRSPGELSLFALARHLKQNPFGPRQATPPAPEQLAEQFLSLFPTQPIYVECAANENWEHLARYLEHDYMVRSKKNGGPPQLAIIVDGIEDFRLPGRDDTFRHIANLKKQMHQLNGTLWLLDALTDGKSDLPTLSGLAEYLLRFDYDGSLSEEAQEAGNSGAPASAYNWEFGFPIDPKLRAQGSELSLVRIQYTAHGSHQRAAAAYLHLRSAGLFKELNTPATPAPPGLS